MVALLAVWLLHRPYPGVVHDARIYMGKALAELDPGGIGRDLMFTLDKQSQFTLFGPAITAVTEVVGMEAAAYGLTLAGLTAWFAGAWVLVKQLAEGRIRWAALVCVIALPARYAVVELFSYGEPFITPRLYAEAAALAGLGFFLKGRPWLTALFLAAALTFHPLMGLPALAIVAVALSMRDKRWLMAAAVGGLGLIAAALAGLPVAGRLFTTFDPEWVRQLRVRNAYIFPTLWEQQAFSRLAVQATTVVIAASLSYGRVRSFLHAVAVVGVGGTVASVVLGGWLESVLAAQLQAWRGLWVLAVAANAGLAIVAVRLWRAGPSGRLVLPFVAAAWVLADGALFAVPLLVASVGLYRLHTKSSLLPGKRVLTLAWSALGLIAVTFLAIRVNTMIDLASSARRAGAPVNLLAVIHEAGTGLLLAVLAIAWAVHSGALSQLSTARLATIALVLALAAAFSWDARSPYQQRLEEAAATHPVAHLVDEPDSSIPIVWVEETMEAWALTGRPSWGGPVQAAGGVFSRELALEAEQRLSTLIDLGLASPNARDTFQNQSREPARPTAGSIRAACDLDPPVAAVIIPGRPPRPLVGPTWKPEHPAFILRPGNGWAWDRFDEFSVINCG